MRSDGFPVTTEWRRAVDSGRIVGMARTILPWAQDHIGLIALILIAVILFTAWLLFQAIRGQPARDEVGRLRARLYELERERSVGPELSAGPLVLAHRWIPVGASAVTSDGGCFLLVEGASALQRKAVVSVRVDGLPARMREGVTVGQRLEVTGKAGVYTVDMQAADKDRARLGVHLQNRHVAG